MCFIYPRLSRLDFSVIRVGGPGLGNLFFPWARAVVASEKYKIPIIYPTWPQIKFGPIIRRESDRRNYINLFTHNNSYISGYKKIYYRMFFKHKSEEELYNIHINSIDNFKNVIFNIEGLGNYFKPILKSNNLIFSELKSILSNYNFNNRNDNYIGVHLRYGDFISTNQNTEHDFYVNILKQIRTKFSNYPIRIFSDGNYKEFKWAIEDFNAYHVKSKSAISDILDMSRSNLLIGTANSTYSAWASFLGRMPVLWPEEHKLAYLYYDKPSLARKISNKGIIPTNILNSLS